MAALPSPYDSFVAQIAALANDTAKMFQHATEVRTRARTMYYRVCFINLASISEALLYEYIRGRVTADPGLLTYGDRKEFKPLQKLSAQLSSTKDLYITECVFVPGSFDFVARDFNAMIQFAKAKLDVSESLRKDLDAMRKKRNHIHIQSQESAARSYTRQDVDRAANIISKLLTLWRGTLA